MTSDARQPRSRIVWRDRLVPFLPFVSFLVVHAVQLFIYRIARLDLAIGTLVVPEVRAPGLESELSDLARRIEWGLSGLALAMAWLAFAVVALVITWRSLAARPGYRRGFTAAGGAIAAALFAYSLTANPMTLPRLKPVLDAYFELRGLEGRAFLYLPNAMLIAALVLLAFAASATLLRPSPGASSPDELKRSQLALRTLLYVAAVLLVTGVVQVRTLHRLPVVDLGEAGEPFFKMADSLALSTGGLWTLLLLTIYLPSAAILSERGRELARTATSEGDGDAQSWLHERGLDTTPLQHLLRLGAALTPFVAGSQAVEVLKIFGS